MKKIILGILAVCLTVAGITFVGAAPASAHTGDLKVTAVCNTATGQYDLTAKLEITQSNLSGKYRWRVGTTTFDGTPNNGNGMGAEVSFPGPGTYTLTTFSLPGNTTNKGPWVYAFTKWSDNFTKGSDGQLLNNLGGNCVKNDVKDAVASVSVTAPTCDTPATLVYGNIQNATFSGTPNGTQGPGNYNVTATAANGHAFADNTKVKNFTGTLDGKLTTQNCFVQPPADKQTRERTGQPNCNTRTITSVTEERTREYVWNGSAYVAGPWSKWIKVASSVSQVTDKQCPRTSVRGAVSKIDKCRTSGDLFKLKSVKGGEYVVNGKVRQEGVWLRANGSRVNVYFKASSNKYKVVGQTHWHLTFTNKACATPPTEPPHTGARTVA